HHGRGAAGGSRAHHLCHADRRRRGRALIAGSRGGHGVTKEALARLLERAWYEDHWAGKVMAPLGWAFAAAVSLRRLAFAAGIIPAIDAGVPVLVVGNLTVGGTGKTPLVIWLARYLIEQGYRPGIVSRGYGGTAT